MRAAIKRGNRILCDEIAELTPAAGQVLVRTCACGICGSDLHALQFPQAVTRIYELSGVDHPLHPDADVVFGHEFAAEILDFGPATERKLRPGSLVTSVPRLIDQGQAHVVGYSNVFPGGYAERMLLSEQLLLPVPNGLSAVEAALTEPFSVGEHAVAASRLDGAGAALVIGCGPVGLAVIAALKARGFGPVIAADFAPGRRALAEQLGADRVVDPADESPHRSWREFGVPQTRAERMRLLAAGTHPPNPVVFECVGVPGVLQSIVEAAPATSQIIVVGVCMQTDRFEPAIAIAKELDLRFVLGYSGEEFARTLSNIAEGRINAGLIVTRVVGLSEVAGAFAALATPGDQAKIVIDPSRS
ncbi:MAG: zinc-binding dehydrogenase [Alphaproteobacteria bacterium]|nr:zinc-binding dehydrogenase [Alphaproteobacteria bacterium]